MLGNLFINTAIEKLWKINQSHINRNNPNSISSFRRKILGESGIARPNRYEVTLWRGGEDLTMPAEAVTLPGRSFVTLREQWFGPERSIPIGSKFDGTVIMTFPVADNQFERFFFERWMNEMVDNDSNLDIGSYNQVENGSMEIATLDGFGKKTSIYRFEEVYPSHILPGNLGASMFNDYTRMQVQFEYRIYRVTR